MELKIKDITFPEVIEFNFEELKKEITDRVDMYRNLVYTEDQIKQAKADRSQLNKFVKVLSDERIKVKRQCLQPYEVFEAKIKELSEIVQEPIGLIDIQIKSYEEQKRQEKYDTVRKYFDEAGHPEWLRLDMIFDPRWLNASVTLSTAFTGIDERLKGVANDLSTLRTLKEYGFEACEVYKRSLDINRAILEAQRMADIAKRKAEMQRVLAEQQAAAEQKKQAQETVEEPKPIVKQWVEFRALLSKDDAFALADFFRSRGIEFRKL